MPLLKDLVKGEDVLERRLTNLETQSRKLNRHLTHQTLSYFDHSSSESVLRSFPLPKPSRPFTSVDENALHAWIRSRSRGGLQLGYDKLAALGKQ